MEIDQKWVPRLSCINALFISFTKVQATFLVFTLHFNTVEKSHSLFDRWCKINEIKFGKRSKVSHFEILWSLWNQMARKVLLTFYNTLNAKLFVLVVFISWVALSQNRYDQSSILNLNNPLRTRASRVLIIFRTKPDARFSPGQTWRC